MIPAKIEPPAPLVVRLPAQRAGGKDREAPAFDKALREQEAAPTEASTEDQPAACDVTPPPANVASAPTPAPLALETLIAQALPPYQQPAAPREIASSAEPARQAPAEPSAATQPLVASQGAAKRATTALAKTAIDDRAPELSVAADVVAPAADAPKNLPSNAQDAPGQVFRAQRDAAEAQDSPSRANSLTPANSGAPHGAALRDRRSDADESTVLPTRGVAIRKVVTVTHFPVTTDPVRQIAAIVTRALDAPGGVPAPAESATQPIKTISVRLEPESLGTVTLRMRLSGNQLSVRVDVAEPATLELIQRDRDRLQNTMASGSVSVDRLEILPTRGGAPLPSGENAGARRQDMNAPEQQGRQNGASHNGEQRGGQRSQQPKQIRGNGDDYDSPRGSDPRSRYL